jgi:phytoene dehydrogenase-like protein
MVSETRQVDVAIVGGGVAGLAAAALLARAGRSVVSFEKAAAAGGRAVTHRAGEFLFNQGPHALYRRGHGQAVLRELGVRLEGGVPTASGGYAIDRGRKHTLPGGFVSLLTTGLFALPAKLEMARLLAGVARIDPAPLARTTLREWVERTVRDPAARRFVEALVRLSTYANAPQEQSAGAALAQLQLALSGNVLYLDGGWQTLVDGLRDAAAAAGARIVTSARVAKVEAGAAGRRVALAGGEVVEAAAVILATPPEAAAALVGGAEGEVLRGWAARCRPVRAACLDVGLSRLPVPRATFALGIDEPLYFSVHSARARLGPTGAAVVHVAQYLPGEGSDAKEVERRLESLLDLVQPGWRGALVERRYLPNMQVTGALVSAQDGGLAGRPGPQVAGTTDLFVAGDWVGPQGMLADASLASAGQAAEIILRGSEARVVAAA